MSTSNPDFTLLPAEDPQVSPDDAVAASAAGALADPTALATPIPDPPPIPFGRSWVFDWELGQFVVAGAPDDTVGTGTLAQWCLCAIHTARYACPVFSDEFGTEDPDDLIGEFAAGTLLSDWQAAIVEALMVHDRITSVENFDASWDPAAGVLTVTSLDVITDEDQTVTLSDITVQAGGIQ